jgi:rubrerythrin
MKDHIHYHLQKLDADKAVSDNQIIHSIINGISKKLIAVHFYEELLKLTPTTYEYNQIEQILEEEKSHLKDFQKLYFTITNHDPQVEYEKITFRTYRDGLLKAYENELTTYEDYRNAYLLNGNTEIKDCFFKVFTDELKHANRFMFLYFRDNL